MDVWHRLGWSDEGVTVPLIHCLLDDDSLHDMYELINPLSHSFDFGVIILPLLTMCTDTHADYHITVLSKY